MKKVGSVIAVMVIVLLSVTPVIAQNKYPVIIPIDNHECDRWGCGVWYCEPDRYFANVFFGPDIDPMKLCVTSDQWFSFPIFLRNVAFVPLILN